MGSLRIVDVSDTGSFGRIPPCADPSFDHRTCDYWEDADRGSKAARASWLAPVASGRPSAPRQPSSLNPFAPDDEARPENPFLAAAQGRRGSIAADELFGSDTDGEPDLFAPPAANPFAPTSKRERPMREGVPRKLGLLDRGRGIFGSYAKVLLLGDTAVAYAQFGPLSAYPRATRLRDLYPQLPQAPLPAVITCIATTPEARRQGHARTLIADVCARLRGRRVLPRPDPSGGRDERRSSHPLARVRLRHRRGRPALPRHAARADMTPRLGAILVRGRPDACGGSFAQLGTVRAARCELTFAGARRPKAAQPFHGCRSDQEPAHDLRHTGLHTASPEPSDHSHRLLVLGAHDCTTAH